jgi:hypothetical protein
MRSPAFGRAVLQVALGGSVLLGCVGERAGATAPSELSGRSVLSPSRVGVLTSRADTLALPRTVALGASAAGRALLYLEFQRPEAPGQLLRASLLLSAERALGPGVEIEVSRADAPGGELRRWSDRPRALQPRSVALLEPEHGVTRLDVTELLREPSERGEPLRLMLGADPREGEGVSIATGVAGGRAPRLELYWQ